MNGIDALEFGGATSSNPFRVIHHGDVIVLSDPTREHYQWVLAALKIGHVRGIPEDIPAWQHDAIFDRWRVAWGLPLFGDARRLAYLVDKHRGALTSDLARYTSSDLGELWRARRWSQLLDIVDRLPAHSHSSAALSNDEEHAKMLAQAIAARPKDERDSGGPSLTTWTPEVAMLAKVVDAVQGVRYAVVATQVGKKAGEPPAPESRPETALDRQIKAARFHHRKAAHESLVARVLPQKRPPETPVH